MGFLLMSFGLSVVAVAEVKILDQRIYCICNQLMVKSMNHRG